MGFVRWSTLLAFALLCNACGSHDRLLKKQEEMDARIDQVVAVQADSNTSLKELSQQLSELQTRLKGIQLELDQLKPGYSELRSTIESTSVKLEKLASDTERRLAEAVPPPPQQHPAGESKPSASGEPSVSSPASSASSEAPAPQGSSIPLEPRPAQAGGEDAPPLPMPLYSRAFRLYAADRYDEAITLFDRFLSLFPKHAYAPNALYWKGECYYSLKNFDRAYDIFTRVGREYPGAGKVPDAMLKTALTLAALGKGEKEQEALRELIARFPRSEAAAKARERLAKGSAKPR